MVSMVVCGDSEGICLGSGIVLCMLVVRLQAAKRMHTTQ